jgi:hypothetical protein
MCSGLREPPHSFRFFEHEPLELNELTPLISMKILGFTKAQIKDINGTRTGGEERAEVVAM